MVTQPIRVDLDLNQNELQNVVIQNLNAAPLNPKEGQIYYNTTNDTYYGYANGAWVALDSQGRTYVAGAGIDSTALSNGTIQTSTTIASKTDIHDGPTVFQKNGTAFATITANQTGTVTVNYTIPTTASDIGALPSSTVIGDGKVIFQKNGTALSTVSANQTATTTINYTIPTAVTDLSDAGNYALKSDVASAVIPKGSISAVSGLPTLVADHRGWMYNFSDAFTTTSDFVEGSGKKYPAGTNVVVVEYSSGTYKYDVFSGFVDTEAYDTHIANTTIHVTATDKTTWNGKQDAISDLETIRANATAGAGAATTISGYGNIVTHNTSEFATSTQGGKADTAAQIYTTTNPALTASSGVCTWTVTHSLGSNVGGHIYDATSGQEVICYKEKTSSSVMTVKLNSSSNIASGTYSAVIIGK